MLQTKHLFHRSGFLKRLFLLQIKIAGLKHVAAVLIIYKLQSAFSELYDNLQHLRLN